MGNAYERFGEMVVRMSDDGRPGRSALDVVMVAESYRPSKLGRGIALIVCGTVVICGGLAGSLGASLIGLGLGAYYFLGHRQSRRFLIDIGSREFIVQEIAWGRIVNERCWPLGDVAQFDLERQTKASHALCRVVASFKDGSSIRLTDGWEEEDPKAEVDHGNSLLQSFASGR